LGRGRAGDHPGSKLGRPCQGAKRAFWATLSEDAEASREGFSVTPHREKSCAGVVCDGRRGGGSRNRGLGGAGTVQVSVFRQFHP
jgi:hypothetical protein